MVALALHRGADLVSKEFVVKHDLCLLLLFHLYKPSSSGSTQEFIFFAIYVLVNLRQPRRIIALHPQHELFFAYLLACETELHVAALVHRRLFVLLVVLLDRGELQTTVLFLVFGVRGRISNLDVILFRLSVWRRLFGIGVALSFDLDASGHQNVGYNVL